MPQARRLLLINHEFPPTGGGAATASARIAEELSSLGLEVTVLTSRFAGLPAYERMNGYTVLRIPALRRKAESSNVLEMATFLFSSLWWVFRRGATLNPDICIAFFGIPAGPAAWLLYKLSGVPYIVSLRGGDVPGFLPESLRTWHILSGGIIRFLWRNAAFVVANSKGLAQLARRAAPKQHIEIIPNGVLVPEFARGKSGFTGEGRPAKLISVGRLHVQKNYPCLLEALARLKGENWRLEIIGDGPEREALSAAAKRLGLADSITFSGWLDRHALLRRLAEADIFVFPSIQEGMPNAVLEAMAMGLPVVACRIEGCEELVLDGETGFLAPAGDVAAFGKALERLLSDAGLCAAFGETGKARVKNLYTWKSTAEAYLRLRQKAPETAPRRL